MRSLGLDIGDRRTGVAVSDPEGILAIPLAVIDNRDEYATVDKIFNFVQQYKIERIIVGLPYSLDGSLGQQANKVVDFTEKLQNVIAGGAKQSHFAGVAVQMWDERLSTKAAEKLMVESGTKKEKRKQHRDSVAAAFILQGFLDSHRPER
jgi:putative Holliday junction resolvase